ncbi:MAG: hypothetical protein JSV31_18935, partial [Desulfobacterales bacterium]
MSLITFTISLLIGCATSPKELYNEYDNSIRLGSKYIQINKEFQYVGNLSTSVKQETVNPPSSVYPDSKFEEHFFMHLNTRNKIDKGLIVSSYKIMTTQVYFGREVNFSDAKNYKSH